jgi:hypothetical protein
LYAGLTPSQAFYSYFAATAPEYAQALPAIDSLLGGRSPWSRSVDPQQDGFVLLQPQFTNAPTWMNWGASNYHSLQIGARKSTGRSLFGANYVLSKSIDNASSPENADVNGMTGQIPNAFRSGAQRGLSDFDVRHNFNAYWVANLPFGKGQLL